MTCLLRRSKLPACFMGCLASVLGTLKKLHGPSKAKEVFLR